MRETWYMLEDGRCVDPATVAPGEDGALVHESGVLVAMKGPVPFTRSILPDEERARQAMLSGQISADSARSGLGLPVISTDTREITAEKPKSGYKTRAAKVE